MEPLPSLDPYTDEDKRICELQLGFVERLQRSAYYIVENVKTNGEDHKLCLYVNIYLNTCKELPRYIDKYRPSVATRATLKRKDFHQPFFPPEVFEGYFNARKQKKGRSAGFKL